MLYQEAAMQYYNIKQKTKKVVKINQGIQPLKQNSTNEIIWF